MEGTTANNLNRWMSTGLAFRLAATLVTCGFLCGCQVPKTAPGRGRTATSPAFHRHDGSTPFLGVRLFYSDAATVRKLVDRQDDFSTRYRGIRRVGDGVLSIGLRDGRGRWLETFECGGHLFVTGSVGQSCQFVVRNESKARLEILAGMDGNDALNGGLFDLRKPGYVIQPLQTVVIGKVSGKGSPALRFGPGRSLSAGPVVEPRLSPSVGSILLVAFMEKDVFPWEGRIRRSTSARTFPQRKYQTNPLSAEYR